MTTSSALVALQPGWRREGAGGSSLRGVHTFDAELWPWGGAASWVFVTVPAEISDDVRARTEGSRGGFGSVRVEVTVGGTTWRTSVFPDSRTGCYLLPVKKAVRTAEELDVGDTARVRLELL